MCSQRIINLKLCSSQYFFWEAIDLTRRIVLTGALLMIHDSAIAIRIVVALLTSLVWLVLILTLRPFKRVEFDALTIISSFTLSCVYFGVLMVKLHGDLQVSLAVFVGVPLTPEDVSATVTSTFS